MRSFSAPPAIARCWIRAKRALSAGSESLGPVRADGTMDVMHDAMSVILQEVIERVAAQSIATAAAARC